MPTLPGSKYSDSIPRYLYDIDVRPWWMRQAFPIEMASLCVGILRPTPPSHPSGIHVIPCHSGRHR